MNRTKFALVTGASSGIGRSIAERLGQSGWQVFAGVRSEAAADEARALHEAIRPVILDVTDGGQIAAAQKVISEATGSTGLQALVNNAGVGVACPIEYQPIADVRRVLETNVIGHVAVTQAFLPLLRRGGGRIVFMSSGAGFIALPMFGAYAASKFALEAVADSLRRDLRPWRLPVINIEPGFVKTRILVNGYRDTTEAFNRLSVEGRAYYAESYRAVQSIQASMLKSALPPERVAATVLKALEARRPRLRYPVGMDAWLARFLRLMPARLADALIAAQGRMAARNADQPAG